MRYYEEKIKNTVEIAQTLHYTLTVKTEEMVQYETEEYGTVTQRYLPEETKKITEQFPLYELCIMLYDNDDEREHWLNICYQKKEIGLRYAWVKNDCELILHCDEELTDTVFEHNLEFDRIVQVFKQLVEGLPEYRLRILTGELELDDWT